MAPPQIAVDSSPWANPWCSSGVVLAIIIWEAAVVPAQLFKLQKALEELVKGNFLVNFLCVCVAAPFFEEWLCRGMVLRGLLTRMKPGWAIVISALFFALIHFNPWQALNAFIIGMVMGFVYYKTGSLKLTMLLHFINNASAVVIAHMPGEIDEQSFILDLLPRSIYIPAYIAAVAVLIACLVIFARIPLRDKRGNMDEIPAE